MPGRNRNLIVVGFVLFLAAWLAWKVLHTKADLPSFLDARAQLLVERGDLSAHDLAPDRLLRASAEASQLIGEGAVCVQHQRPLLDGEHPAEGLHGVVAAADVVVAI